ncbi:DUF2061 domain-containing protein [Pollutimonas sp. H1-120]|uniref:DUF2061 domain-containing protein n=1 Tax=Pollutimonas sp. H1-120 TaxID=3148824 RepID=UPI003B519334
MLLLARKTSQMALHMSVAFAVTYICTGSLATGGLAAILEPVCNVVLLPLHDKLWSKAQARRRTENHPTLARQAI